MLADPPGKKEARLLQREFILLGERGGIGSAGVRAGGVRDRCLQERGQRYDGRRAVLVERYERALSVLCLGERLCASSN